MTATTTRRPVDELRALAAQGASDLAGRDDDAPAIAAWAAEHFPGRLAVACSMADAVLPYLVAEHAPGVDVLFLDTGYHFSDTLVTRDLVAEQLDINVVDVKPRLTVAEQDAEHGVDLFARDPAACCRMRKVEPLRDSLGAYDAWVTGVRRDEGPTRADAPVVSFDETFGLVKINPLVTWSLEDLLRFSNEHRLPVNLLVTNGYPSIGCEPCTRPVEDGADARAGRWSGFAKTECGLHA
ncbi:MULTISPECIES: phosphoadenylyl-sulfate reductase [Barrientosiimonas]|uniref:Adenosine 5'-phosphosulfate reductase n=1 Tax=Barrientosiimonas endolithica TaxID=1535208 RepID=A0ABM8HF69_9MICO|nr:phosphoadenylyl-sulfate reductase [Barrientosiimonas endolithica]BDZ59675.1 phosphoadenosine phosphosulfate reductase [Barrientosiimonas endolithica]